MYEDEWVLKECLSQFYDCDKNNLLGGLRYGLHGEERFLTLLTILLFYHSLDGQLLDLKLWVIVMFDNWQQLH